MCKVMITFTGESQRTTCDLTGYQIMLIHANCAGARQCLNFISFHYSMYLWIFCRILGSLSLLILLQPPRPHLIVMQT